jgi:hypothetical protein
MLVGVIVGGAFVIAVLGAAIWILRQPVHRYQGDPTPAARRSMRETMVAWLIGGRG